MSLKEYVRPINSVFRYCSEVRYYILPITVLDILKSNTTYSRACEDEGVRRDTAHALNCLSGA